jgi:hypothetical protein
MTSKQTVLFIGGKLHVTYVPSRTLTITGTGGQGIAIVRVLSATNRYDLLVLTRDVTSNRAKALAEMPNVEVIDSESEHGYNLPVVSKAASRADAVFCNTDGFALGEMAETYWGIRLYEVSARAGVKHFIYSGLDYNGKKSGYDDSLYVGHFEGKARVQGRS